MPIKASAVKLCECGCGEYAPIASKTESRLGVVKGQSRRFIHGHYKDIKHGLESSAEYKAFWGAQQRCQNPKNPQYMNYGARGIEFRFDNVVDFYAEVGPRPTPAHSLDRIDNDGHYEKGNLRWATKKEQRLNQRAKRIQDFSISSLFKELCVRAQGGIS
jgi:hypothetical protein